MGWSWTPAAGTLRWVRILDAGDDAAAALAFGTDQNVDAEDAAHEFGLEQVSTSTFAAIVDGLAPHGHCQDGGAWPTILGRLRKLSDPYFATKSILCDIKPASKP